MNLQDATLALLTWRAPRTLERTLASLRDLRPAFGDALVVCQCGAPEEVELAERYGYRTCVTLENVGIQSGLELAVRSADRKQVLVLENDNCLVNARDSHLLEEALELLQRGEVEFVQFGDSVHQSDRRAKKYWQGFPPRRTLAGRIRWARADAWLLRYCLMHSHPVAQLPSEKVRLSAERGIAITDSRFMPWSNRAFFVRRDFFLEELIPLAESARSIRRVNGHPELEQAINGRSNRKRWRRKRYRLGVSLRPLFGHERQDRPAGDEKALHEMQQGRQAEAC